MTYNLIITETMADLQPYPSDLELILKLRIPSYFYVYIIGGAIHAGVPTQNTTHKHSHT